MGVLDRFRRKRGEEMERQVSEVADVKAGLAAMPLPFVSDQPQYPETSYEGLAEVAFQKNELAFSCISLLMRTFTEAPVQVVNETQEPQPRAFIRTLLDRPNPFMSEQELWEHYILHRRLAGNFFVEKVRSSSGRVVELWPLRPDRVLIVPDADAFIGGYVYQLGSQRWTLRSRDVLHIKAPNPLNAYFGMADLWAGLRETALDNELTDLTKVHAQNRGVNPGTVVTRGDDDFDRDTNERVRQMWREKFGGGGRGDLAVFPKGSTVTMVGMNLRDLAFPDLRDVTEARICGALGVPPIMVGANVGLKRSTYSNYDSARESLWFETIAPEQRKVASKLESDPDFAPERGGAVIFDTSRVHALRSLRNQTFDRADRGVVNGWLTINEGRSMVGLDPKDGADVFLRQVQTLEVEDPDAGPGPRSRAAERAGRREERAAGAPETKARTPEQALSELRRAIGRTERALSFYDRMLEWARAELAEQGREAAEAIGEAGKRAGPSEVKAVTPEERDRINEALGRIADRWGQRAAESVRPVLEGIVEGSATSAAEELGADFAESRAAIEQFVREYSFQFAASVSQTSAETVRSIVDASMQEDRTLSETRARVLGAFTEDVDRAQRIARSETIRASNRGAEELYRQAGVQQKRWVTAPNECPFCAQFDGRVVSVGSAYAEKGQAVEAEVEGATRQMRLDYEAVQTPPLHPNCRCTIVAVVD